MIGKNIGYIRCSTVEQNDERQFKALEPYSIDKIFQEKVSAKDTNRPELQAMLDFIREGDTVYISDFSRIARSTKDLLEIVEALKLKGVKLISLKENIDSNTATGALMLTMIGAINEFERANLLERQREGIAIAKAQGKYKGRKEIQRPANWNDIYTKWKSRQLSGVAAMQELGLKRNTFYSLIKQWEEAKL